MILLDANVFMYAAGKPSPQREPCQRLLREIVSGTFPEPAATDTEVLQEILHRYRSIGCPVAGFAIFDSVLQLGITILVVEEPAMRKARQLLADHPGLSTRDAVHAGVMDAHRLTRILTYDRGFSAIDWVDRVEPAVQE